MLGTVVTQDARPGAAPSRRRRLRRIVAVAAVLLACTGIYVGPRVAKLWQSSRSTYAAEAQASELIGAPAPDWNATDLGGSNHTLADFRGKVVVLDFWYSSCGHCLNVMPHLKELASEFSGQPVQFIGMNVEDDVEKAQRVVSFVKPPYPTLRAGTFEKGISVDYKVTLWPTVVILDKQGVVRHYYVGDWPWIKQSLSRKIRALL